ncbi:MAG TPA: hypothetical protein VGH27_32565 [Streptosporangiaceae bacterium]|jgi:hypothetical protein
MDFELRMQALQRADENEKAAHAHLVEVDRARMEFTKRGQTFAMWLAAGVAVPLLIAGLVCILITVAGVVPAAVGLPAGSILLAGSLIAGVTNLIRSFLPRD